MVFVAAIFEWMLNYFFFNEYSMIKKITYLQRDTMKFLSFALIITASVTLKAMDPDGSPKMTVKFGLDVDSLQQQLQELNLSCAGQFLVNESQNMLQSNGNIEITKDHKGRFVGKFSKYERFTIVKKDPATGKWAACCTEYAPDGTEIAIKDKADPQLKSAVMLLQKRINNFERDQKRLALAEQS